MRAKVFSINNTFQYLLFIITIGFLTGCSKGNEPEDKSASFGIYLLEDQSITWEDLKTRNLDSLKLKDWITGDKIDFYDYSTHVIYLNVDYNTLFSVPHNDNTPFVVVANEKRCYYGRFSPPQDTTQPHVVIKPLYDCDDLLMLEFNPLNRKDIRFNDNIKSSLNELGKIKLGFNSEFPSVRFYEVPGTTDTILEIFVVLKNDDEEVLYAPHLYGIINAGGREYSSKLLVYNNISCFIMPVIPYYSSSLIYTLRTNRILRGQYAYCHLTLPKEEKWNYSVCDFPLSKIPPGEYNCIIEYYGMLGGSKETRYAPKGRMWTGYLRTNTISISYDGVKGIVVKNKYVSLN